MGLNHSHMLSDMNCMSNVPVWHMGVNGKLLVSSPISLQPWTGQNRDVESDLCML